MSVRSTAFVMALAVGLAGDILLRASPWGVGFSVWLVIVSGAAVATLRAGGRRRDPTVAAFLVAAMVFGTCLALRDSPELRVWNVAGALIALGMALIAGRGLPLAASGMTRYAGSATTAAVAAVSAPMRIAAEGLQRLGDGTTRLRLRLLLATLVTVPLVLLFGALFTSADPVFAHLVRTAFGIDIGRCVSHALVIAVLTWSSAGYALALMTRQGTVTGGDPDRLRALGLVEIAVPMVALTVLFVSFLGVQAGYLFGGGTFVQTTVGLSFAAYARRGFFELVTASGLMIPVVIAGSALLREDDPRAVRWFRRIARMQIICVGLVMVSALERLRIYYHAYGLTVDRLLAAAVMLWIGFTLGWFVLTVLRGHHTRFPLGVVAAGLAVLAMADAVNPDAVVVRANLRRAAAGLELDARHLSRLSGDAIPALMAHAERLPPDIRAALIAEVSERWFRVGRRDWRSWNLGYARARDALMRAGIAGDAVVD